MESIWRRERTDFEEASARRRRGQFEMLKGLHEARLFAAHSDQPRELGWQIANVLCSLSGQSGSFLSPRECCHENDVE